MIPWMALAMVGSAAAGEWSEPKPYVLPILNINAYSINGAFGAQASAGLAGGARVRYKQPPHWLSHSRAQVVGSYGLTSGSLGADLRVGSFIGPNGKVFLYQVGPDVWYNGYGTPELSATTGDYYTEWTPGVDLSNTLTLKMTKELQIVGVATPAWVFSEGRQSPDLPSFVHELTLAAMLVIRTQPIRLTVGYSRRYMGFGIYEGLILSGAI